MPIEGRRVLVTDAHANAALATVRSLGARGFRVSVVAEEGRLNLAGSSRYAERVVVAPAAAYRPHDYLAALAHELSIRHYSLLLSVTDTTVTLVDQRRTELERFTTIALPSSPTLQLALDKNATMQLASDCNVAAPETRCFQSIQAALECSGGLRYPCVIKPRFSRGWTGEGPVRDGRVQFVSSQAAFREIYPRFHRSDAIPLVQDFVSGSGVGVFALVDHGNLLTTFLHRRLREVNPTGGPASLAESVGADERLIEPARRLLARARWHGVAMVEFKDEGCHRPPLLMEINGRLWGSLPLAITAGVDFPHMVVQLFLGEQPWTPATYRVGLRCRHLRGDLSHLGGVMRGAPDGWPGPFPGPWKTLANIAAWPGRWTPYNMRLTDPWPGLVESWQFLKDEWKAVATHRIRASAAEAHR